MTARTPARLAARTRPIRRIPKRVIHCGSTAQKPHDCAVFEPLVTLSITNCELGDCIKIGSLIEITIRSLIQLDNSLAGSAAGRKIHCLGANS